MKTDVNWLVNRQQYINASEVADILSVYHPNKYSDITSYTDYFGKETKYNTKYRLLHNKLLNLEQIKIWDYVNDTPNTRRGKKNESQIILEACKYFGFRDTNGNTDNTIKNGLSATADAILECPLSGDKYTLEVKNPKLVDFVGLKRYEIQIQIQLYVNNLQNGKLFIKVEDDENYQAKNIKFNNEIIDDILKVKDIFWSDVEKLKANNDYILPDLYDKKDVIMLNIVDKKERNKNLEEAMANFIFLEDFAKNFNKAQDFLKAFLTEDRHFDNITLTKIVSEPLSWTLESIDKEIKKASELIEGTERRRGNINIKKIYKKTI